MCIDSDEYLCYIGRNSGFFEKNVNEHIQCVHGYEYSSGKQKMCTGVNEDSWIMMKNCFPDAKPIKNSQELVFAKNVHMFKYIYMKMMRKLIPQKIMNLPFYRHIFCKDMFLLWKLFNKG